jgi:hypothetical protein
MFLPAVAVLLSSSRLLSTCSAGPPTASGVAATKVLTEYDVICVNFAVTFFSRFLHVRNWCCSGWQRTLRLGVEVRLGFVHNVCSAVSVSIE